MSDVSRDTMLLTTPFHSRVEAMCDLNDWGNWMGYTTPTPTSMSNSSTSRPQHNRRL